MISAASGYYPVLAVYTGHSVSSLNPVPAGEVYAGTTFVSFDSMAGTEYQIAVSVVGSWEGAVSLLVNPLTSPISLPDALDCAAISWSGDWLSQTCVTHDGVAAARSHPTFLASKCDSVLNGTVVGPGTLSFSWKDSRPNDSFLHFWMNGTLAGNHNGESGWQRMSFYLPSGSNNLQWIYTKLNVFSPGEYAGYLDEVSWVPTLRLTAGLTNGSLCLQVANANGQVIDPQRVSAIEVYATTTLSLNMSNWLRLTNSSVLTNGVLRFADPEAALLQQRFYQVLERP